MARTVTVLAVPLLAALVFPAALVSPVDRFSPWRPSQGEKQPRPERHTHVEHLAEWYREPVRAAIVTSESYMRR